MKPHGSTIANYSATAADYTTDLIEHPEVLQEILQKLGKKPYALVVGCGPADDAAALMQMGFAVTGIDNAPGMITEAKKRNPAIKVIEMHMNDVAKKFQANQFDLIFAHYSLFLEQKAKLPSTISNLIKVLKVGGFFYLTTQESMTGIPMETLSKRDDYLAPVYINAETGESLTELFTKVGVQIFFIARRPPRPEEHQFFKLTLCGQKL